MLLARAMINRGRDFYRARKNGSLGNSGTWNHDPLVLESRNCEEYQAKRKQIENQDSQWLRDVWFAKPPADRSDHLGHCIICRRQTSFNVDDSVYFDWEGHRVPWWANTLTCSTCHQVARIRGAFHLFEKRIRPKANHQIYITEQVTSLYHILKSRHSRLIGSEFLIDSTPAGKVNKSGVRSEDLTALSFPDACFDHLLTFEVLEHIPDYQAALRECARVLRPGGKFFCTVPFHGHEKHYIRARLAEDGSIEHLLPPEYHGNPLDPTGSLCYRYFGIEFLDDLRAAGFSDAFTWTYWSPEDGYLGTDRSVFVAVR